MCAGELFAQCPIESYPSAAIEQVLDSSRYFVVRIQDGGGCLCIFLDVPDIKTRDLCVYVDLLDEYDDNKGPCYSPASSFMLAGE